MSQDSRTPQPPSKPQAPRIPWQKPAVVETSCGLEINCYAPARI